MKMEKELFNPKQNLFVNQDGLQFLNTIEKNTIDLILTDPPYITSRESGMNTLYDKVQENCDSLKKTETQWEDFSNEKNWDDFFVKYEIPKEKQDKKMIEFKENFINYGTIFGKKFAVKTNYGDWDKDFTMELLGSYIKEFKRVLRDGGTGIIFFDLWKIGELKRLLENNALKQIRFIEWNKTNPQPLNSKRNYLTNSREVALTFVKKSKPVFNSSYDTGIYNYPIAGGSSRFHPTQKNEDLFIDLIKKHSNPGDIVLDTFAGSGTTLIAAKKTGRYFLGSELDNNFYNLAQERISKEGHRTIKPHLAENK